MKNKIAIILMVPFFTIILILGAFLSLIENTINLKPKQGYFEVSMTLKFWFERVFIFWKEATWF